MENGHPMTPLKTIEVEFDLPQSLTVCELYSVVLGLCDRMYHKWLRLLQHVFIQTFESVCCVEYI